MGKNVHDSVLDGALNVIKSNCNLICVCSSEPTTRSHAVSSYKLASVAMSSADFSVASGSSGGRKVTVAKQSSLSVDSTGSAQHVALVDAAKVLLTTICTKQNLTKGNKVNIPAWTDTIADPA